MSQTSYQQDPNPGLEGQLVDASPYNEIVTGVAEAAIIFGRFVFRSAAGAADDRPPMVDTPALTGDVTGPLLIGVAMSDPTKEAGAGWAIGDVVRIMRRGRIWMVTEDAVIYGAPVFVRFTAGGSGIGSVRSDIDGGDAVALPGASFRGIAGIAGLVPVEYNPQN